MYPNQRVVELITREFVNARAHIKEQAAMWPRFAVRWTPTVLILDPSGQKQRRVEGFLPVDEFLGQLLLGLGDVAASEKRWTDAEPFFARVAEQFPNTDAAPEGLYWAGVARYSATRDKRALQDTATAFEQRYTQTSWAKRASVWRPQGTGRAAA